MEKRASGILMHISSLPSKHGIGTFGKAAYEFVDFLQRAGQKYWQLLPIVPISYGDSPYQSFSSYAGNPYFIDFDLLQLDGLLDTSDYESINWGDDATSIDYKIMFDKRYNVLKKAYARAKNLYINEFNMFLNENSSWVNDYALFMALKYYFNLKSWIYWDDEIKKRYSTIINYYTNLLKEEIEFWEYVQFFFFRQWFKLKQYANEKGISIIGDMPIYVAEDSVDVWSNPNNFCLDSNYLPSVVAGCPPDLFSKDGQLWGNPVYNWDYLESTGYKWWINRISHANNLFDVIRLDHFRGFDSYYVIPYGSKTARHGIWKDGPGIKFINLIKSEFKDIKIIAEDLGVLTKRARKFVKNSGFPGMKVLQFAFSEDLNNMYLPHNYHSNSVVYTGTHDNNTTKGWLSEMEKEEIDFLTLYVPIKNDDIVWSMIKLAYSSISNLVIIPMQDLLKLDETCRMNLPGTIGGNWKWRINENDLSSNLSFQLLELVKTYERL